MRSSPLRENNLAKVKDLLRTAGDRELVLFPEYVFCLGDAGELRAAALPAEKWHSLLGPLAERHGLYLLFGGVPLLRDGELRCSCLMYGPDGSFTAAYDKMHLFRLYREGLPPVDESLIFGHGDKPRCADAPGWKLALSICYDLRFPELYRLLIPFDLLLAPAAFAEETGKAHWHLLLRARAVENQCFAAAAAQCGVNETTGLRCYGHSLVVDPWGEMLLDAGPTEEGLFCCNLERRRIEKARAALPALENRRIVIQEHMYDS